MESSFDNVVANFACNNAEYFKYLVRLTLPCIGFFNFTQDARGCIVVKN